ncbi:MAG: hypothetical protein IPM60_06280 [Rhodospirillales bacterium]|nr:hypothetical protein [Rhodospirillales bacterium]
MRVVWRRAALAAVGAMLAGCASDGTHETAGCIPDASGRAAEVDWSAAQTVDVRIRHDDFSPIVIGLLRERPYVLRFSNGDDERHEFSAPDLFRTVVLDGIAVDGRSQPAGCYTRVAVPANGTAEVRFMPLLDGRYEFKDTDLFGMTYVDLGLSPETGQGFGVVQVR